LSRAARRRLAAAVATLVVATACARPTRRAVAIHGMAFEPAELVLQPGDDVVWTNQDLVPHTVTADDGAFDSGAIAPGASWQWHADRAGDHAYSCRFHPTMKGELRVR
jgi:plastocyanin